MARLLIADDDKQLVGLIEDWLKHQNYVVDVADNGTDAREFLKAYIYDVIILDWDMPGISGVEVCRDFRKHGGSTPVLMLTGLGTIEHKEQGLDAGADDYLTKPVDLRELSARVRALMRRPPMMQDASLRAGDLSLDPSSRQVKRGEETIELWPIEFALLEFLMRNPNQVYSADALLQNVWKAEASAGPETVRTTIKRLRKRIDKDPKNSLIKNVYGFGYKLQTEPD